MSLTSAVSSLCTTLEEKSASISVLKNLIEKQKARFESEIKQFEQEQDTSFQHLRNDNAASISALQSTAQSWIEKNNSAQARINDLKADIASAERDARERVEAMQQSLAETKKREYLEHKQQQRMREKEWYEQRKAEIEKLTWKGMSQSIARLLQQQDETCSSIMYDLELKKEKLEAHYEQDTLLKIQSFQHSEDQSNSCVSQKKKELADLLSREYDAHNARLLKLKKTLMQDEEALKKHQAQDTTTLINEHEAALTKVKLTLESKLQLSKQSMMTRKNQIEQRHKTSLGNIDKDISEKKELWDKEQAIISDNRMTERNEQNRKILMRHKELEIKALIKKSLEKERLPTQL